MASDQPQRTLSVAPTAGRIAWVHMSEVPDWDDGIHGSIKALIQLVDDRLPELRSAEFPQPRVMAAAYLARVLRLVRATEAYYEAEMPDVVGIPFRVCFEAWVTGMWVVLVGKSAADQLNADYAVRINKFVRKAKLDVEHVPEFENVDRLPNLWERTDAVANALVAAGDEAARELLWSYSLVYDGESTVSIHAGFPAVIGHLDLADDDASVGVQPIRVERGDGSGKLLWATTLLIMLARRVFIEFGVPVAQLDEVGTPIYDMATRLNEEHAEREAAAAWDEPT